MSLCTHNNPAGRCVDCGTWNFRTAAAKAKQDLLDAVMAMAISRIERLNKKPLSDAFKKDLLHLDDSTLVELAGLSPRQQAADDEPAPKEKTSPYATEPPSSRSNAAAPKPIDIAPIVKANRSGVPMRKALLSREEK